MAEKYTRLHAQKGLDAKLPRIETWQNQFPSYEINIEIPEFTSVCPKTGLPDFGLLILRYTPDKKCLELKSLKMYLLGYRNQGIFYENAVNKILRDIVKAADPLKASLTGVFNSRGGIECSVVCVYDRKNGFGGES